jgi:hypothetical protein
MNREKPSENSEIASSSAADGSKIQEIDPQSTETNSRSAETDPKSLETPFLAQKRGFRAPAVASFARTRGLERYGEAFQSPYQEKLVIEKHAPNAHDWCFSRRSNESCEWKCNASSLDG